MRIAAQGSTSTVKAHPQPEPSGLGMVVKLDSIAGLTDKSLDPLLPFVFQVPPVSTFPTARAYSHDDYMTVSGFQRSRPSQVMLKTWTWQTIFTDNLFGWTLLHGNGYIPDPLVMLDILDSIGRDGSPVLLTARNPNYDNRFRVYSPATLRLLDDEDRDGELDAKYVTVAFTEYAPTSVKVRSRFGGGRGAKLPVRLICDQLPANRSTMYQLALYYYGSSSKWTLIAKANSLKQNPSFNLHKLGHKKIVVPKVPKA